jgi:NAD(P)-dependent dehydrogenase (short-subunit alcohol dehydrogenase family)
MTDQNKYVNRLEGQRVLVIGGSSGIGFGVAEASLEYGAIVIIASSQQSRVDDAISRLLKAHPSATDRLNGFTCNLADETTMEDNIKTLFAQVTSNGAHKLDHIIFTAGTPLSQVALQDATVEVAKQSGMVRFFAPMFVVKHAIAGSHFNPGPRSSFTFTTGTSTEKPIPGWTVGSINGATHSLNRSLALELKPIRCNLISPGAVLTELWDPFPQETREAFMKGIVARLPTGRIGRVEDVAEAYLYVMKDENITGTLISTNGGSLLQ